MNAIYHHTPTSEAAWDEIDRALLAAMQDGLPLVPEPYAKIASQIGLKESEVIQRLEKLQSFGILRRLGLIVRHHELGYRHNAMTVFDIPDQSVDAIGQAMARQPFVNLCYRRPRCLPDWPYNLFCMVHGRSRSAVVAQIDQIRQKLNIETCRHEVLFSVRRFKQMGARFDRVDGAVA